MNTVSGHYGTDVTVDGTGSCAALEERMRLTAKRGTAAAEELKMMVRF